MYRQDLAQPSIIGISPIITSDVTMGVKTGSSSIADTCATPKTTSAEADTKSPTALATNKRRCFLFLPPGLYKYKTWGTFVTHATIPPHTIPVAIAAKREGLRGRSPLNTNRNRSAESNPAVGIRVAITKAE